MTGQFPQARLLIIADDLTGAADCAARCRHAGMQAAIHLAPPAQISDEQAQAISTDTRHLTPEAARTVVLAQVRQLLVHTNNRNHKIIWYKKIDSTLRGNLGAELDAMLDARDNPEQPAIAVVCPAFPAQARGLEDGFLVYGGGPLPALHLPTLLQTQTQRPVTSIPLSAVRTSTAQLRTTLSGMAQTHSIIVADAITDGDLHAIIDATTIVLPDALLVGSAGMVGVLAHQLVGRYGLKNGPDHTSISNTYPVLVIVGSGSDMAQDQIRTLAAHPRVHRTQIEPDRPLPTYSPLTLQDVHLLHLPPPSPSDMLEGARARSFASTLSNAARSLLPMLHPIRIVLVGGDTTTHVLRQLQIQKLTVLSEILPGIPLVAARIPNGTELTFILKAGNHGSETTLVDLVFGTS